MALAEASRSVAVIGTNAALMASPLVGATSPLAKPLDLCRQFLEPSALFSQGLRNPMRHFGRRDALPRSVGTERRVAHPGSLGEFWLANEGGFDGLTNHVT
jgi:hypothetical protein